ncbi:unnamed protein product [Colias eurytheme]|nr:unnamed protein product [Colias eurytheme]
MGRKCHEKCTVAQDHSSRCCILPSSVMVEFGCWYKVKEFFETLYNWLNSYGDAKLRRNANGSSRSLGSGLRTTRVAQR